ncbi:transcription factor EB-like [Orycteropus afer afer]|uniref:Transcription factor EB-like n=1 Tax=Orycteropus afer afer TaxID=1230840 RepID=A0AC54ZDQ6_ORYAF|nr:transcription factor EB-like [Orycteropus afer afer]
MASRIGLHMQLMREQAQQEEHRERMQQQAVMHYMQQQQQLGGPPTPAINTPVHFQSPPPVPGEVLKVQSYLENPTSYHLQQSRDQKVREYLSETYGNKFAAHISPAQGSPKPPPAASPGDVRWNKGTILKASVDYIRRMQKDLQKSRELENHSRRLEMTNKQLWLRIQELEIQARVHGLPTTSPSGMNMAELAQQVVKQELPSEEGPGEALLLGAEVPDPEPLQALPPQAPLPPPAQPPQPQSPFHHLDFSHNLSFGGRGEEGPPGYPEPLGPEHGSPFPSLSKKDLDLMLLDDSLLPLVSDPLFSTMSPEASKASSRRSSFSMEEGDVL